MLDEWYVVSRCGGRAGWICVCFSTTDRPPSLFQSTNEPTNHQTPQPTNQPTTYTTSHHHHQQQQQQPNTRTAEEGVSWEFAQEGGGNPLTEHHVTPTDRSTNPWFGVFYDSLAKRGVPLTPEVSKEEGERGSRARPGKARQGQAVSRLCVACRARVCTAGLYSFFGV